MAAQAPLVQSTLQYERAFKDFPVKEVFRLFIDKTRQAEGEDAFDKKEPGYKDAMLSALDDMRQTLGNPLNAQEYKRIRALCIKGVKNLTYDQTDFFFGQYPLYLERVSKEAKAEWYSERLIMFDDDNIPEDEATEFLCMGYNDYPLDKKVPIPIQWNFSDDLDEKNAQQVQAIATKKIDEFFACYYAAIQKANTDNDKLTTIVSLCRKLSIGHFFADANQRTIVFVLLNKLLIENNFSPVILEDPYVFDGYHSKMELVADVKTGMANFMAFKVPQKPSSTPPMHPSEQQKSGIGLFKPEKKEKDEAKLPSIHHVISKQA